MIPTAVSRRFTHPRLAIIGGIGVLVAAFGLAILLLGDGSLLGRRVLFVGLALLAYALTGAIAFAVFERQHGPD